MHHYIVIEGPLGVGKTTLAKMLVEKLNAQAVLEDVEENPCLLHFYENPNKFAFQTQIFFLLRRYNQASELGLLAAAYFAACAVALIRLKSRLLERPRLFASSLAELRRDEELLRS